MDRQDYFRLVARMVRHHSTFSHANNAWMISVPHLKTMLQQQTGNVPPHLPSVDEVLETGVRVGFWEMDIDHETEVDIVVFK